MAISFSGPTTRWWSVTLAMLATLFAVLPLASIPSSQQLSAIVTTLVQLEIINQNGKMMLTNVTTDSAFYFDDGSAPNGHRGLTSVTDVAWGGGPQSISAQNNANTIDSSPRTAGIVAMGQIRYQGERLYCSSLRLLKDSGRGSRRLRKTKSQCSTVPSVISATCPP